MRHLQKSSGLSIQRDSEHTCRAAHKPEHATLPIGWRLIDGRAAGGRLPLYEALQQHLHRQHSCKPHQRQTSLQP